MVSKLLIQTSQSWYIPAVEALYETPFLSSPESFVKLSSLLANADSLRKYSYLIRELLLPTSVSENLLMGDLSIALKSCPNLISLRIENCGHLSNQLSGILSESLPFLYRLELPGCYISDVFVKNLLYGCNNIRHLDLSQTNITLAAIPIIIKECKFLETLDMTGVRSPDSTSQLVFHRSSETLNQDTDIYNRACLKRCSLANTNIDDHVIAFLVQCCNNLEALLLDNCPFITDSSASYIAQNCPRIQIIGLSFCQITDVGLQSISGTFFNDLVLLSSQVISKDTQKKNKGDHSPVSVTPCAYSSFQEYTITEPAVDEVQLNQLYLAGCYRITPSSLIMLAESCPRLDIIVLDGCDSVIKWFNLVDSCGELSSIAKSDYAESSLTLSKKQILVRKHIYEHSQVSNS